MGIIATNKRKITLIYNSETSLGKQAYGYVQASNKKIHSIDISKTKITGTQWVEIAENLNQTLSDLVNQDHPEFVANYPKPISLTSDDWIKVLNAHPEVMSCSILIDGKTYHLIKTPSEITKLLEDEESSKDARSDDELSL